MKFGPLTFQCACLICVCRSMQSASRALSRSTTLARVASDRSFFVLNILDLLIEAVPPLLVTLDRPEQLLGPARRGLGRNLRDACHGRDPFSRRVSIPHR